VLLWEEKVLAEGRRSDVGRDGTAGIEECCCGERLYIQTRGRERQCCGKSRYWGKRGVQ
jgi:hypothetical protein